MNGLSEGRIQAHNGLASTGSAFRFVCFLVVILRDPFTDLGNRHRGKWIFGRIVIRRTVEHTYPQQAFLQKFAGFLFEVTVAKSRGSWYESQPLNFD
jgi:hypothetical protein